MVLLDDLGFRYQVRGGFKPIWGYYTQYNTPILPHPVDASGFIGSDPVSRSASNLTLMIKLDNKLPGVQPLSSLEFIFHFDISTLQDLTYEQTSSKVNEVIVQGDLEITLARVGYVKLPTQRELLRVDFRIENTGSNLVPLSYRITDKEGKQLKPVDLSSLIAISNIDQSTLSLPTHVEPKSVLDGHIFLEGVRKSESLKIIVSGGRDRNLRERIFEFTVKS